ncbi:MAG: hypothetical protein IJM54_10815 [Thermoguttaceae bacterium]|nr:hypothetical protein [Thermoguttaceae bacterium]
MFAVTFDSYSIFMLCGLIIATILIVVSWLYWSVNDLLIVLDVVKWFRNLFHKDEDEDD